MWVWFFMLISIIGIRFLIPEGIGEKRKNLIFLCLSFLILVFVVGSRSPHLMRSSDLSIYYECYGDALSNPLWVLKEEYKMEEGYLVLNKILAWFVPWNYYIIYFEAAFCTGVMFWYIYRNAESVFLAVIVYICLGPWQFFLTGFRQAFAVSICFIALEFIKKHKVLYDIAAVALIALASALHITAWLFLLVFLLRMITVTKKVIIYAALLTLFLLVTVDDLIVLGNDVLDRDYTIVYYGNVFAGLVPILIYISTFILCYLIWTWDKTHMDENHMEIIMLITGLCIYVMRYNMHIMERVSYYFTPVISVLLANAVTRQRTKKVSNVVFVICVALCVILFIYRASEQYGEYHFYWEYLERLEIK
ncbi:MAG: EpsG family protein [Ruminococcus sp.]|nr:EpsG family protein [Ruminococcus sp.]